jgi:DNA polymerase-3 subunit delta'
MHLIGHVKQKDILISTLKSNKLLNGYIFSGKEGIGKRLFALEFAKSILCSKKIYFKECDCPECKLGLNHPDIKIIDESPILIDTIRDLTEYTQMFPFRVKNKVIIINNAHLMAIPAANAFLKTLEEPAEGTVFILITNSYEKLLDTIKSRCIKFEFSRLKDEEVRVILEGKGYQNISEDIIKTSSGSVLTAINLIEKQNKGLELTIELIKNKKNITKYILPIKDKGDLKIIISEIYKLINIQYKKNGNLALLNFENYLLEISRRLDYNVNLDIFKADFISKIIGVLSEEI